MEQDLMGFRISSDRIRNQSVPDLSQTFIFDSSKWNKFRQKMEEGGQESGFRIRSDNILIKLAANDL